jgi:toxin-antitoxin system PIN domain toxin
MIVIDANVLLYAIDEADPRHRSAARWVSESIGGRTDVGLALVTVLAFIRIATDARVYHQPLEAREAIDLVGSWLARDNVTLLGPVETHWTTLATVAASGQARGPLMMDAHLATLVMEHGATLATTDRDFKRFEGLQSMDPTSR